MLIVADGGRHRDCIAENRIEQAQPRPQLRRHLIVLTVMCLTQSACFVPAWPLQDYNTIDRQVQIINTSERVIAEGLEFDTSGWAEAEATLRQTGQLAIPVQSRALCSVYEDSTWLVVNTWRRAPAWGSGAGRGRPLHALAWNLVVPAGIVTAQAIVQPENQAPYFATSAVWLGAVTLPRLVWDVRQHPVVRQSQQVESEQRVLQQNVRCTEQARVPGVAVAAQVRADQLVCMMPLGQTDVDGVFTLRDDIRAWLAATTDAATLFVADDTAVGLQLHPQIQPFPEARESAAGGETKPDDRERSEVLATILDMPDGELMGFLDHEEPSIMWALAANLWVMQEYVALGDSSDIDQLAAFSARFVGTREGQLAETRLNQAISAMLHGRILTSEATDYGWMIVAQVTNRSPLSVSANATIQVVTRSQVEDDNGWNRLSFEGGYFEDRTTLHLDPGETTTVTAHFDTWVNGRYTGIVIDIFGMGPQYQRRLNANPDLTSVSVSVQNRYSSTLTTVDHALRTLRDRTQRRHTDSLGGWMTQQYFGSFLTSEDPRNANIALDAYLRSCSVPAARQTRELRRATREIMDYLPGCGMLHASEEARRIVLEWTTPEALASALAQPCTATTAVVSQQIDLWERPEVVADLCDEVQSRADAPSAPFGGQDWRVERMLSILSSWNCTMQ